ncbi:MAG: kelch repeat-containing protein [Candidatus Binataceae bacterium]
MLALAGLVAIGGCANPVTGPSETASPEPTSAAAKLPPSIPAKGDVLIAGGVTGTGIATHTLATAEFFDPAKEEFLPTHSMATSRAGGALAVLSPGKAIAMGGFTGGATVAGFTLGISGTVTAGAEIFDELTGEFSNAAAMGSPRVGFTATTLKNGKVLIAGGIDAAATVLDTAEIYDPATGKFSPVNGPMSDHRVLHSATLLDSGRVLIAGGVTNLSGEAANTADLYDPATNSFSQTRSLMDHERAGHTATLLGPGPMAGDVLITGGGGGSGVFLKDSSAEIYDPASQQFTLLTSFLNEARSLDTATLLDNGTVLIAGGFNGSVVVAGGSLSGALGSISNSAEIFDPATGDFTCVGGFNSTTMRCAPELGAARAADTATLMTAGPLKGAVLIAGGIGGTNPDAPGYPLSSAILFNPANGGSFSKAGYMTVPRAFQSATLLN